MGSADSAEPTRIPTRENPPQTHQLTLRSSSGWVSLSPYIAECLRTGFSLPWVRTPTPHPKVKTREMDEKDRRAISTEVQRALDLGAIYVINREDARVISPAFCVPKADSDKIRVIIDLRHVNSFLPKQHFKTTTLRDAVLLIEQGVWMAKIDMKDAFWHIPLAPDHHPYLCFEWENITYAFRVAPFGLSLSPVLLNKTTKPVIAHLNGQGVSCVIYVDDLLIVAKTKEGCRQAVEKAKNFLRELGWHLNDTKSVWDPTQVLVYLGLEINSKEMTMRVPPGKMDKVKMAIRRMRAKQTMTARELAQLLGQINSLSDALFQVRVFTTGLQQFKKKLLTSGWDYSLAPPQAVKDDLEWWELHLERMNGKSLLPFQEDAILTTDASMTGWGAILETPNGEHQVSGAYSRNEQWHINYLELEAVIRAIQSFASQIRGLKLLLKTDSIVVMYVVNKMGSNVPALAKQVERLFLMLRELNCQMRAVHIAGIENPADGLSREADPTSSSFLEAQLNPTWFQAATRNWGPFTIDLFASARTAQLKRYCSWGWDPEATLVNAFNSSWRGEFPWINPPFILLHKAVKKIINDKATAVILFPVWPASPWWVRMMSLVIDLPLLLPRSTWMYQADSGVKKTPFWSTVICKVSANDSSVKAWRSWASKQSCERFESLLRAQTQRLGENGEISATDVKSIHLLAQSLTSSATGSFLSEKRK